MSLKKIFEGRQGGYKVKVFRDSIWDEYVAKIYKLNRADGAWECTGDYHTGDKKDALLTGNMMLFEGMKKTS